MVSASAARAACFPDGQAIERVAQQRADRLQPVVFVLVPGQPPERLQVLRLNGAHLAPSCRAAADPAHVPPARRRSGRACTHAGTPPGPVLGDISLQAHARRDGARARQHAIPDRSRLRVYRGRRGRIPRGWAWRSLLPAAASPVRAPRGRDRGSMQREPAVRRGPRHRDRGIHRPLVARQGPRARPWACPITGGAAMTRYFRARQPQLACPEMERSAVFPIPKAFFWFSPCLRRRGPLPASGRRCRPARHDPGFAQLSRRPAGGAPCPTPRRQAYTPATRQRSRRYSSTGTSLGRASGAALPMTRPEGATNERRLSGGHCRPERHRSVSSAESDTGPQRRSCGLVPHVANAVSSNGACRAPKPGMSGALRCLPRPIHGPIGVAPPRRKPTPATTRRHRLSAPGPAVSATRAAVRRMLRGSGSPWTRRRSAARRAAPTPRGSARRPRRDAARGRSSSRFRRAGGRSTRASPGAAAIPPSTDAAGGACRPRAASRPTSRAVRPRRRSAPPPRRRRAGRPSS
jgi:hypothetical protein